MSSVSCPHCGTTNVAGAAFCESCGKALPVGSSGPRVVDVGSRPASAAGTQMLGDELGKLTRRAANTLLVVGILQLVLGSLVVFFVSQSNRQMAGPAMYVAMGVQITIGVIFLGLSFWARKSPLPASIIGLVLYGTLVALNVVQSVSVMGQGQRGSGIGGVGIGFLDIIIIAFLAQGIKASLDRKKLLEKR